MLQIYRKYALRVPPAVTRLTVYRRLRVEWTQYLKTTTRAFKCIDQIRKAFQFGFRNMLKVVHENLKMQIFQ